MAQQLADLAVEPQVKGTPPRGLSRQELLIAAQAAWLFRESGSFPSELVCEHRGFSARTPQGTETQESVEAWHDVATALGVTPTAYLGLLMSNPDKVARTLLRVRSGQRVNW